MTEPQGFWRARWFHFCEGCREGFNESFTWWGIAKAAAFWLLIFAAIAVLS